MKTLVFKVKLNPGEKHDDKAVRDKYRNQINNVIMWMVKKSPKWISYEDYPSPKDPETLIFQYDVDID